MQHRRSTFWLIAALAVAAAAQVPSPARGEDKITLAVGTTVLNVGYPMVTLPLTLGLLEGGGLRRRRAAGRGFAASDPADGRRQRGVRRGQRQRDHPVKRQERPAGAGRSINGVIDWSLAVDADGPIKSINDIKGKTIGVFSLATGGIAYLNTYLRANGIDPAKDVDFVPLGLGAPPVEALRSGKVQGLLYWAAAISTFENAGLKLRKLVGDDWRSYPDYSLSTMQATISKNPAMVIAIARGVAKATVFALANPDCALKLHWAKYPSTKPSGADEATLVQVGSQQSARATQFDAGRFQAQWRQVLGATRIRRPSRACSSSWPPPSKSTRPCRPRT